MKRIAIALLILAVTGSAWAANLPDGVTGLWRFATQATRYDATVGTAARVGSFDNGSVVYGAFDYDVYYNRYTAFGTDQYPLASWDNGSVFKPSMNWLNVDHGVAPNGTKVVDGVTVNASYVNQYTFAIDYQQDTLVGLWNGNYYNSLFQTAVGNSNDGELFIKGPSRAQSVIGGGDIGYSTATFDSSQWHRIVWSVDNANFFRVYVDGVLFLDAAGQGVDGRYSLDPSVNLLADNDWEDAWGYLGTAIVWNHALTSEQVAAMGNCDTPLTIPEPGTIVLLIAGLAMGLIYWKKK